VKDQYRHYIDNLGLTQQTAYGKCHEVCQEMLKHFPELKLVRGHYECLIWGERGHWWLVDPDGETIDPTVIQFPCGTLGYYTPWDESKPIPTGVCPNCSGYCYDGTYLCSDKCSAEYAAYCLKP
jgi:hypothetical protein